jgi:hypothetical protein
MRKLSLGSSSVSALSPSAVTHRVLVFGFHAMPCIPPGQTGVHFFTVLPVRMSH